MRGPRTRAQKAGLFALATFLFLLAKYPNRAIGTRPRPDIKSVTWKAWPLIGHTYTLFANRDKFLDAIIENFESIQDNIM